MSVLQPKKRVGPRAITARERRFVKLATIKLRTARRPTDTRRGLGSMYRTDALPPRGDLRQSRITTAEGVLR